MSYGTARCNANGVVVNRNFDIEWEEGTDDPSSLMYRGPASESEPEMRLLLAWFLIHVSHMLSTLTLMARRMRSGGMGQRRALYFMNLISLLTPMWQLSPQS
uniref:M14 family zinc carboxypeptidase n=1 Tax=Alcaligenes faecalis TaxID=511 RepID=UPI003D08F4EB